MRRHLQLAFLFTFVVHSKVVATELANVELSTIESECSKNVGQARLQVFFFNVYDSELYTSDGEWQENGPYCLVIRYLRAVSAEKLVEETEKAWRHQNKTHACQQDWLHALEAILPDVLLGDTLTLWVNKKKESIFFLNNEPIGLIEHPIFGDHFGGIWLAENSPRPILRRKLIGSDSG